jgi:hypothetical protein
MHHQRINKSVVFSVLLCAHRIAHDSLEIATSTSMVRMLFYRRIRKSLLYRFESGAYSPAG